MVSHNLDWLQSHHTPFCHVRIFVLLLPRSRIWFIHRRMWLWLCTAYQHTEQPSAANDWSTSNVHRCASLDDINDREEEDWVDIDHQSKRHGSLANSCSSNNSVAKINALKHQQRSRSMEFESYFSDQDGRVLRADSRSASIDVSQIIMHVFIITQRMPYDTKARMSYCYTHTRPPGGRSCSSDWSHARSF